MAKIRLDNQAFALPMPLALLGSHVNGKPNFMALGWFTRVNFKPPLLGVGVNHGNQTHGAILENREFSLSIPSRDLLEETDYTGLVSAKRTDKSGLFETFYGDLKAAPMVKACPVAMELTLVETVEMATNTFFIGEIKGVYAEQDCLEDGAPDPARVKPFVLTMPDNRYWAVGEPLGRAWHAGKVLKEKKKK